LLAVFGTGPERVDEPDLASPGESPRVIRKEPARFSRPIPVDARKPAGNHWERWLIIFVIVGAFRYIYNWQSNRPLFQSSSTPSGRLADNPLTSGFSLSSTNGRFEQLQEGSREILRKNLTQEEYDFMIGMSQKPDGQSVTWEELNRSRTLMKKIESTATAEEKANLTELRALMRRLAGEIR
jgi:hypothetical protein